MTASPASTLALDCRRCGACCAYAAEWPRFTTESEAELGGIPPALMRGDLGGMRCAGDRCAALAGDIGVAASCTIYPVRPHVCRACEPGDDACLMARRRFGL